MSRLPSIANARSGGTLMIAWRLSGRPALVVGGGRIAAGRTRLLLESDATVTVVSPSINKELKHREARDEITWCSRAFTADDLSGVAVVLCAVKDRQLAEFVSETARTAGVPVNVADSPSLSDFAMPATHRMGPLRLALSSDGLAPSLMGRLVRALGARVPSHTLDAIARFAELRRRLRANDKRSREARREWLRHIGTHWSFEDLAGLGDAALNGLMARYEAGETPPGEPLRRDTSTSITGSQAPGRITLVGAGPGDPGLLTRAAAEAIDAADLVVADRLVPSAILDMVPCELRVARKFPGQARRAQREITAWVMDAALAGRHVVRLKAGDAFLFGRAGEELDAYSQHAIAVAVIPGVSSALAAPVQAGIPTTLRAVADRVLILTGQGANGAEPELPPFRRDTTILMLMAIGRLDTITDRLLALGYPADWPTAIVERASLPSERTVRASLYDIATRAKEAQVRAPAVIILGEVARSKTDDATDLEPNEAVTARGGP